MIIEHQGLSQQVINDMQTFQNNLLEYSDQETQFYRLTQLNQYLHEALYVPYQHHFCDPNRVIPHLVNLVDKNSNKKAFPTLIKCLKTIITKRTFQCDKKLAELFMNYDGIRVLLKHRITNNSFQLFHLLYEIKVHQYLILRIPNLLDWFTDLSAEMLFTVLKFFDQLLEKNPKYINRIVIILSNTIKTQKISDRSSILMIIKFLSSQSPGFLARNFINTQVIYNVTNYSYQLHQEDFNIFLQMVRKILRYKVKGFIKLLLQTNFFYRVLKVIETSAIRLDYKSLLYIYRKVADSHIAYASKLAPYCQQIQELQAAYFAYKETKVQVQTFLKENLDNLDLTSSSHLRMF